MDIGRGRDNFFTSIRKMVCDRLHIPIWNTDVADTVAGMVGNYSDSSVPCASGVELDVDVQNTCMSSKWQCDITAN